MIMLKHSGGKPSASFTMMIVAFSVVTLWLFVSILAKIGHVEIRAFNASEAMAYLTPILLLYWGRRRSEEGETGDTIVVPDATAVAPAPTAVAPVAAVNPPATAA